jgi:hypothetical protein
MDGLSPNAAPRRTARAGGIAQTLGSLHAVEIERSSGMALVPICTNPREPLRISRRGGALPIGPRHRHRLQWSAASSREGVTPRRQAFDPCAPRAEIGDDDVTSRSQAGSGKVVYVRTWALAIAAEIEPALSVIRAATADRQ